MAILVAGGVRIVQEKSGDKFNGPHAELISVPLYLANNVRPNFSFSVRKLARCCSDPKVSYLVAAKRVLWYLERTRKHDIIYHADTKADFLGFVGSDFAEDYVNCEYTTGCAYRSSVDAISWRSRKQIGVALSTSKVEYDVLSTVAMEAICIFNLAGSIGITTDGFVYLFGEPQTFLQMTQ